MRRFVHPTPTRRAVAAIPAALLAAGLTLFHPLTQAAAQTSGAPSANPTVRICLARDLSGSSKLFVSRLSGDCQASLIGDSGSATTIEPQQLIEFQYAASASSEPIERKDDTHLLCRLAAGQTLALTPTESDSSADSDTAPSAFCLQSDSNHPAHHYRGALQITALANGTLRVINSIALEQYLKGVVGPEIGESAPLEALKAQAIAARTYTIKNLGKLALAGADLDDTNRCQNYMGVDAENWRCRTAVEQTAGEVLTYQGSLIDAVYATDCGGMTAQGDAPYLKPVADPECAGANPWTVTVATSALQTALAKNGIVGLSNIDYVSVHDRDPSGRAATLTCTDEATGETEDVSAILVRKALGYDLLRSTLFRVDMTPDAPDISTGDDSGKSRSKSGSCAAMKTGTVTFVGKGWGHGLGMCQHGAVEMARLDSATDDQILRHFYNGVDIVPLTSDLVEACALKAITSAPSAWSGAGLAAYAAGAHRSRWSRAHLATPKPVSAVSPRRHASMSETDDNSISSSAAAAVNHPTAVLFPRRGF